MDNYFWCPASPACDDRSPGKCGFHVNESERLTARWKAHDIDSLHQVGHVATEAENLESVVNTELASGLLEFGAERPFTKAPELRFRQTVQHKCSRLN